MSGRQVFRLKNVFVQALKRKRFFVMLKKVKNRFFDNKGMLSKQENLEWLMSHCSNFETLAKELDPLLWDETLLMSKKLESRAHKVLREIEYDLGAGGIYPFLYFITRYTVPDCIVETGVAAGFSSYAFLSAIKVNGKGKLYSSDFPYFRLPNPERYIGVVVEESLTDSWSLYIDGDEINIPKIFNIVTQVDIFHYDSDKSYSGRELVVTMVEKKMSDKGIILMDDIQDNSYFHDYIKNNHVPIWYVFRFQNKYVGMAGKLTRRGN